MAGYLVAVDDDVNGKLTLNFQDVAGRALIFKVGRHARLKPRVVTDPFKILPLRVQLTRLRLAPKLRAFTARNDALPEVRVSDLKRVIAFARMLRPPDAEISLAPHRQPGRSARSHSHRIISSE